MGDPRTVDSTSGVTVTATGPIHHLCPYVDEPDTGTVTITWTCGGKTIELHSLAAYLKRYTTRRVSHENVTDTIRRDITALPGIENVTVTSTYHTACFTVEVTSVVPSQPNRL